MKKLLVAGVAAAAFLSAPALAAPPAGVFNWSGFYIGGSGGLGYRQTTDVIFPPTGTINGHTGGIAGGTIGVNWQVGRSVVGIEGDYSWADIKTSGIGSIPSIVSCTTPCESKLKALGTVRGRIGFTAFGPLLIYGTGGFAFGSFNNTEATFGGANGDRTGWTVGGGIEGMLTPNFTWKIEYLFVNFQNKQISYNSFGTILQSKFSTDIIRAGLNWKFGS